MCVRYRLALTANRKSSGTASRQPRNASRLRHPIERDVELDGIEVLGVVRQSIARLQEPRDRTDPRQSLIVEPRRADQERHHETMSGIGVQPRVPDRQRPCEVGAVRDSPHVWP